MRVLAAKVRTGVIKKKLVDLDEISDVLDDLAVNDRVQKMADSAVTLVKNDSNLVPLPAKSQACLIVSVGSRLSQYGQRMVTEFRRHTTNGRTVIVDPSMPLAALVAEASDTSTCSAIAIAIFSVGSMPSGELLPSSKS